MRYKYFKKRPDPNEEFVGLLYKYNHGGRHVNPDFRSNAGHGDCSVRAIAIATETPYWKVRHMLQSNIEGDTIDDEGTSDWVSEIVLEKFGWEYITFEYPGKQIRDVDFKKNRSYLVKYDSHIFAIVNGVVNDTFDSRLMVKDWWFNEPLPFRFDTYYVIILAEFLQSFMPKRKLRYRATGIDGYWRKKEGA